METALINTDNLAGQQDFLPLNGTDYVEFYVGNARQAAHFYKTAFGFQSVAYAGPETGVKDRASYVLVQHKLLDPTKVDIKKTYTTEFVKDLKVMP